MERIIYLDGDKAIESQLYLRRHALALCKKELTNPNTSINPVMLRNWIETHESQISILTKLKSESQYDKDSLSPNIAIIAIIVSFIIGLLGNAIFNNL